MEETSLCESSRSEQGDKQTQVDWGGQLSVGRRREESGEGEGSREQGREQEGETEEKESGGRKREVKIRGRRRR